MKSSDTAQSVPVIIGCGRVGRSLDAALREGGLEVELRGRAHGLDGLNGRNVLLCVPDSEIRELASKIGDAGSPALIGHSSGATGLDALSPAGASGMFSLHPLQTVPDGQTDFEGCPAAVAGSDEEALAFANEIARIVGMDAFTVAEPDRAVYHAAASIASNFLVTLEQTAVELMDEIAVEEPRAVLEPLIRRSLDNWIERGPEALTGPIARGDESTVAAHRHALTERRPGLVDFYDVLATRTREIALERSPG